MNKHIFDVEIATQYGIIEAILIENFKFWICKNEKSNKNYYDGCYWTYNSTRALKEQFPYISERKIKLALKHLREDGILKTGNYNKVGYDRTLWYTFTEKGKELIRSDTIVPNEPMDSTKKYNALDKTNQSIVPNEPMDSTKRTNGLVQNVLTIPDNNTYINTYNKQDNKDVSFSSLSSHEINQPISSNELDNENFMNMIEEIKRESY